MDGDQNLTFLEPLYLCKLSLFIFRYRIQKLIDLDKSAKQDVKQIHYANLWEMVNYCENTNDCRRVLQLQYLGEVFDSRHCNNSGKEVHASDLLAWVNR